MCYPIFAGGQKSPYGMNTPILANILTSADSLTGIVVGIIAVLFIAWMLRDRITKFSVKHGKSKLEIEADKPAGPMPGIKAKGIKSESGGITVESETGDRIEAENFTAKKDISITQGRSDPKP